ncbi:hypothetical protein [Halorubrum sp. DTA46]|uniref:hypothetical protein n=1 Tax=Halorubrum sp. DTA46 TaxID=3402162 RepID=UPI003AAB8A21
MLGSLSAPMRSLLARLAFLVASALLGLELYALDIAGLVAVPSAVIALLVIGELYLFVAGDD